MTVLKEGVLVMSSGIAMVSAKEILLVLCRRDKTILQTLATNIPEFAREWKVSEQELGDFLLVEIHGELLEERMSPRRQVPPPSGLTVSTLDPPVGGVGIHWAPDGVPKS